MCITINTPNDFYGVAMVVIGPLFGFGNSMLIRYNVWNQKIVSNITLQKM